MQREGSNAKITACSLLYGIGTVITIVMGTVALRSGIGWRTVSLALVTIPLAVALGFANLDLPPLISEEQGHRTALRELQGLVKRTSGGVGTVPAVLVSQIVLWFLVSLWTDRIGFTS